MNDSARPAVTCRCGGVHDDDEDDAPDRSYLDRLTSTVFVFPAGDPYSGEGLDHAPPVGARRRRS